LRALNLGGAFLLACRAASETPQEEDIGSSSGDAESSSDTTDGLSSSSSSTGTLPSACDPAFASDVPSGTEIWTSVVASSTGRIDEMHGIAVDSEGLVYVSGWLQDQDDRTDGWAAAFSADGELRWDDRYVGAADMNDALHDVVLGNDGRIYVAGVEQIGFVESASSSFPLPIEQLIVLAYGPDGEHLWRQTAMVEDDTVAFPVAIDVGPDGEIVVGAGVRDETGTGSLVMLVLANNGALREQREPLFDAYFGIEFGGIDVDQNGNVYIGATALAYDHFPQHWVTAWNRRGKLLWEVGVEHYDASTRSVLADEDGVAVLGSFDPPMTPGTRRRLWIGRYDTDGGASWTYESDASMNPRALAIDCRGDIAVLATAADEPWLARLTADGELVESFVLGDAVDDVYAMAPDPGGNLVLARRSCDPTLACQHELTKLSW
jgi:hypothetical protein